MKCKNCGHEVNAGSLLGSVKSERKAKASRLNGKKGGAPRKGERMVNIISDAALSWVSGEIEELKSVPSYIRCQTAHCKKMGKEVMVQGLKAWLCEDHS